MGALTIAILLGLAALTSQKPQKSISIDKLLKIPELEGVFQEILAQSPEGDHLADVNKHHSKHHGQHHNKNHKNPNLMNIQNLNLIIKNNNLRKKLAKAEHSQQKKTQNNPDQKVLREIEDAICETTGRCGCSGNRCGCSGDRCNDDNEDKVDDSNDLTKLLDSLQNDLENGRSLLNDLRCGCSNNQPHNGHIPPADNNQYYQPKKGYYYNKNNLRCGCRGRRPYQRTSKNDKDKDNNEPGKKIAIDDDLDVVLLELNDLLDKKSKFPDYTRTEDKTQPREVNSQLDPDDKNNDESREFNKNEQGFSPEEMFNYYQLFKGRTIKKLIDYVLHQNNDLDISKLSKRQQEVVKDLQEEIPKLKTVDIGKLEEKLLSLLFGPESAAKVLPHGKKNDNVYVPQWMFDKMRSIQASSQNSEAEAPPKILSRSIFPLTKQQKLKLQKLVQKQQYEKKTKRPGLWRRNLNEDLQSYGAPFELDIQGLGQVNV